MAEVLEFEVEDRLLARAAWSRIAEPGDEVAWAVVDQLGPGEALRWVVEASQASGAVRIEPGAGPLSNERLRRAIQRWTPRLKGLDPRRELSILDRLGGRLLIPGEPGWPTSLDDLGLAAPMCLWVRGSLDLRQAARRSVAVVGARACTQYGTRVAQDVAMGVADRHFTVVSGGAYGIDAAAHCGALAAPGPTVAFLAGGIDRLYPAGNARLLCEIVEAGGALVSEVPPGSAPHRVRFLLRNRLIAAFSTATVVVEAASRSGALSTAARAAELLRPVGAVPGPVTSMASSGCHRLLRDTDAVCVTDAAEVAELAGSGTDVAPARVTVSRPADNLDLIGRKLLDGLPVRSASSVESVARAAGLSVAEVVAGLGHLELAGMAERVGGGWRRSGERQ